MCDNIYKHVLAVTNRRLSKSPFMEQIERVCRLHPKGIILREKDLSAYEYEQLAGEVLSVCQSYDVPCILHQFSGVAAALGASRIHLPLGVLIEGGGKEGLGAGFQVVGASVHSVEEALLAKKLGADYVTAGHIFSTDCKKGVPPRGLPFLRELCRAADIPVYGIGGIRLEAGQIREVMAQGAVGVCVMSEMMRV